MFQSWDGMERAEKAYKAQHRHFHQLVKCILKLHSHGLESLQEYTKSLDQDVFRFKLFGRQYAMCHEFDTAAAGQKGACPPSTVALFLIDRFTEKYTEVGRIQLSSSGQLLFSDGTAICLNCRPPDNENAKIPQLQSYVVQLESGSDPAKGSELTAQVLGLLLTNSQSNSTEPQQS